MSLIRPRGRFKLDKNLNWIKYKSKYMSIQSYSKEVLAEMKNVVWPGRNHTINATILVIVISVVMAIYLFSADTLFRDLLKIIINK